jgi:hypothetical protein
MTGNYLFHYETNSTETVIRIAILEKSFLKNKLGKMDERNLRTYNKFRLPSFILRSV